MTPAPYLPVEIYQDAILLTGDKDLITGWIKSMPNDRYLLFRAMHTFAKASKSKNYWYLDLFSNLDSGMLCRVMKSVVPLLKYLHDKGYYVLDNIMYGRPYLMFFYTTCNRLPTHVYESYKDLIVKDYESATAAYHSKYFSRMYFNHVVKSSTVSNLRWFMDNVCNTNYKLQCPRNNVVYHDGLKLFMSYSDKIIHDVHYVASLMECGMYSLAMTCSVDMDRKEYPANVYLAPSSVEDVKILMEILPLMRRTNLSIINAMDTIAMISTHRDYMDFQELFAHVKEWSQRSMSHKVLEGVDNHSLKITFDSYLNSTSRLVSSL